ncbi:MAG: putative adhesin [Geminicoccaceae bacterium]
MPKTIVFSGHGRWDLGDDQYVQLPAKCSMKFYTLNMKLVSDWFARFIDTGVVEGHVEPEQEGGPFSSVPDMRLFPPHGLHLATPNLAKWHVIEAGDPVPQDNRNIQVRMPSKFGGGGTLSQLFTYLKPAIECADAVTFLWGACRDIKLKDAGGKAFGVNVGQR